MERTVVFMLGPPGSVPSDLSQGWNCSRVACLLTNAPQIRQREDAYAVTGSPTLLSGYIVLHFDDVLFLNPISEIKYRSRQRACGSRRESHD